MNSKSGAHSQEHLDLVFLFALQALSPREMASVEAQILSCDPGILTVCTRIDLYSNTGLALN